MTAQRTQYPMAQIAFQYRISWIDGVGADIKGVVGLYCNYPMARGDETISCSSRVSRCSLVSRLGLDSTMGLPIMPHCAIEGKLPRLLCFVAHLGWKIPPPFHSPLGHFPTVNFAKNVHKGDYYVPLADSANCCATEGMKDTDKMYICRYIRMNFTCNMINY